MAGLTNIGTNFISGVTTRLSDAAGTITQPFTTPTVRLGVTGLSRAGKTVFITSLIHNLMRANRLPMFEVIGDDRFIAAMIEPQPDPEYARFAFEANIDGLTSSPPIWPTSTNRISQIRISIRYKPSSFLKRTLSSSSTLNIDIVDYPGEWLLDLGMMKMNFATWSQTTLSSATKGRRADLSKEFLAMLASCDAGAKHDERKATKLHETYRSYLLACKSDQANLSLLQPGRFIQPGDMEGSPALTFCPLEKPDVKPSRSSLYAEMERRFEHYKAKVITPFFRNHFARLDRQIILADILGSAQAGLESVEELQKTLSTVQSTLRPGSSSWLETLLFGRRIDRVLFAATKADHLTNDQHKNLTALMRSMTLEASNKVAFKGADINFMALSSLRATSEVTVKDGKESFRCVKGKLIGQETEEAIYTGELPSDLATLKRQLAEGEGTDRNFAFHKFQPPTNLGEGGLGLAHIRLDKALEFLVGDLLT